MPCINLDIEYFSHRKVLRLSAKLGNWAEIIPIKLWTYTGRFHPENGLLLGYGDDELISICGIKKPENLDATSILQAMQDCGFITRLDNGFEVCNWLEYQGHIAAFSIRGKEAAKIRWAKLKQKEEKDATSIPQAMLDTVVSNAVSNALTILTDLTDQKEKKEEKNKIKNKSEKKLFNPPSISDLTEFANLHGYNLDCEAFLDYWLQRNWTLKGGQKMADWKAAVRTWERNNLNYAKKDGNNGKPKEYKTSGEKSLDNLKAIFGSIGHHKNPNNIVLPSVDATNPLLRGTGIAD